MIKTWATSARTRRFAEEGKTFSGMDEDAALDLLAAPTRQTALTDLSTLKSVGLHKLSKDRKGQWAMTINGPWRVGFSV